MNVKYSDQAKQWGEGYALLQQATERLEEAIQNLLEAEPATNT